MKSIAVVGIGALGATVAAQEAEQPALGECASQCLANMQALVPDLGCEDAGEQGQQNCLCLNTNWGYGIRDCGNEACGTDEASQLRQYVVAQCAEAGVTVTFEPTAAATGESGASIEPTAVPTESTLFTAGGDDTTTVVSPVDEATTSIVPAPAPTSETPADEPDATESTGDEATETGEDDSEETGDASETGGTENEEDSAAMTVIAPVAGILAAAGMAVMLI